MHDNRKGLRSKLEELSAGERRLLAERLGLRQEGAAPSQGSPSDPSSRADAALVAYVVFRPEAIADVDALRSRLAGRLPDYMVPAFIVEMDSLPRGDTGKVDRGALPPVERGNRDEEPGFVPPGTDDEVALAGIWSDVLGMDAVGIHDSFFEIGGHSLLAVQLLGRIREAYEVELPMAVLFETPTIAGMLEQIDTMKWVKSPDEPGGGVLGEEEFEF